MTQQPPNGTIPTTTLKPELTGQQNDKNALIKSYDDGIRALLPQFMLAYGNDEERAMNFMRVCLNAVRFNENLQKCDFPSLVGAMLTCSALELVPNTSLGQAWIIPYNSNTGMHAQFQMGYQGVCDLFYRHPLAKLITAREVRATDDFDIDYGNNTIRHKFNYKLTEEQRGKVIGFYCKIELMNGANKVQWLTFDDAFNHARKYSKNFKPDDKNNLFHPDKEQVSMLLKTCALKALKFMPKSVKESADWSSDGMVRMVHKVSELTSPREILQLPDMSVPEKS